MKKFFCALFLIALSPLCRGEDGLVIQYHIEEVSAESQEKSSYINAVMMKFGEEHSFFVENLYVLKFYPLLDRGQRLSLVTTLKDIENGKPYYVGAEEIELEIGESKTIDLERERSTYKITLDTSYGTLP